jgi:carbonyl reductase 1
LCWLHTGRDPGRGRDAVKQLEGEGLNPELLVLDVSSEQSVAAAKQTLQETHNRLDVLINNAAIFLSSSDVSFPEAVRQTIAVNYYGLLRVTNTFLPLLQPHGRIIHMSSGLGNIKHVGQKWKEAVLNPDLTEEGLTQIMDQFVEDAQKEDYSTRGWPIHQSGDRYYAPYNVSKIGVNRLAEIQAKTLGSDPSRPGVLVNAVCPGWVRTRMGGPTAHRSIEQGADTPVYLSLLPHGTQEPHGLFLRDRLPVSWRS